MPEPRQLARPVTAGSIAARATSSLESIASATGHTPEDVALIASMMPRTSTLEEVYMFIIQADALGLDPKRRQCYWLKFDPEKPGVLHTGIDGFRLNAARSGQSGGSDNPTFRGSTDVPLGDGKGSMKVPEECTVTVWRWHGDRKDAYTATAWWAESYPGPGLRGYTWRQRPRSMLAKSAEALALRKAFPSEMAGLPDVLLDEEDVPPPEPEPRMTVEQRSAEYERIQAHHDGETVESGGRVVDTSTGEVLEDRPPAGIVIALDLALTENARLVEEALAVGAPVLKTLKADATWSSDRIRDANHELGERIKSRQSDIDQQFARQAGQQGF